MNRLIAAVKADADETSGADTSLARATAASWTHYFVSFNYQRTTYDLTLPFPSVTPSMVIWPSALVYTGAMASNYLFWTDAEEEEDPIAPLRSLNAYLSDERNLQAPDHLRDRLTQATDALRNRAIDDDDWIELMARRSVDLSE